MHLILSWIASCFRLAKASGEICARKPSTSESATLHRVPAPASTGLHAEAGQTAEYHQSGVASLSFCQPDQPPFPPVAPRGTYRQLTATVKLSFQSLG